MALSDGAAVGATLRVGEERVPIIGSASVYVCGITPYDTTHLGHAATFVWTDLAARVLHLTGAHVDVCRNVTDVDDHLLAEASARGVPWRSLATQQTYRFERDASDLGIVRPAFEPKSYDYVDDVIALAFGLLAQGSAYERDGSVFFHGEHVCGTAGLDPSEAAISASRKTLAMTLKWSLPRTIYWTSPSGSVPPETSRRGRVRGARGGLDGTPNAPPWRSPRSVRPSTSTAVEPTSGSRTTPTKRRWPKPSPGLAPFARSWMHVGTVMIGGQKMAKSAGNLVLVHDLLQRWPAAAIRYLILSRPWRAAWEFEESALDEATAHLDDMWRSATTPVESEGARRKVVAALLDDLDVPTSLAIAKEAGGRTAHRGDRLPGSP